MIAAAAALLLATSAGAQTTAPTYVVTYLEVRLASIHAGATLIRAYVRATRADAGSVAANGLQEIGRSNRFVMIETWSDRAAFAAHEKSAHTVAFRENLKIIQRSPYDQRITHGFAIDPNPSAAGSGALYAVTHVDVPGAQREAAEQALRQLFQSSHAAPGHVRYDIYQQDDPRLNHFTMYLVWKHRAAFEAYAETTPWLQFREALAPLLGAPFDERLYHPIRP
jgi:quinol monooxygenase YgiN